MADSLTWAWTVCTYRRHDILRRSFRTVARQTRPPRELIIVDSSPDWEVGRAALLGEWNEHRNDFPRGTQFHYVQGPRPSSAAQRNRALELCSSDVAFFMDDDTFLYPDCAEKLMEVYERDTEGFVQALAARPVQTPPEESLSELQESPQLPQKGAVKRYSTLAAAVRGLLAADHRFVPYDATFPDHPIPAKLDGLPLAQRRLLAGYCLTCRTAAARREPFEERLERYCPGEDSDMTYRLSRHGPLLARLDAKICHVEAPAGRMNLFPKTALGAINPLLLHRLHSTDLTLSLTRNRNLLLRRALIEAAKDLTTGQLSFPQARGIIFALSQLRKILQCKDEDFDQLFRSYQKRFTQS